MAESKSPSGTSLVQSVKRTLLMKKCKEKEAEGNDATASNTNPTSPHTPSKLSSLFIYKKRAKKLQWQCQCQKCNIKAE